MEYGLTIGFVAAMSAVNRARGTQVFNLVSSTVLGRLITMTMMSILLVAYTGNLIVLPSTLALLMLWCTPAWDNYWSMAIGDSTSKTVSTFAPVDFIMKAFGWLPPRLWGTLAMGLRGTLMYPVFAALGLLGYEHAYLIGVLSILQGIPYLIGGIPSNKAYSIPFAEYTWGACMGIMLALSVNSW